MPHHTLPTHLGRFEIVRPLAAGGMARIYLGRCAETDRHVAIKVLFPYADADATMFRDEARLLANLHHPNVAEVLDAGITADGTQYLVMEYIHGASLKGVLEAARWLGRRLPLAFGIGVVAAAAAGLHHAHEHAGLGIVHRDVSPSNLMIGHAGDVKVIDFGIAWSRVRDVEATRRGMVKGKAGYLSPEQLLSRPVDRRSDVFSLGIVAYEATAQARAFRAGSDHETARRVVHGEVRPPAAARPGYPPDLAQVVMNALAVDPSSRYLTAAELGAALTRAATRLGIAPGPAAIASEMLLLFPGAREPWLRARTPRGSGATPVILPDLDDEAPTARYVPVGGDALDPSKVWEPPEDLSGS